MRKTIALFAVFSLTLVATPPAPAQDAEAVVKYRQSIYQVMRWQFGGIRAMLVGDQAYDGAAVDRAAGFLASAVTMLPTAYAEGSVTEDSEALPKIWDEWADFSQRLDQLARETAALDAIDGTDQAAITNQFQEIGAICKDCHDNYKKD